MAGRTTDARNNTHEAEGVIGSAGQFVTRRTSEPTATLNGRNALPAMRASMDLVQAEGHLDEAERSIRASWATQHPGIKTDLVFWARSDLDQATRVQETAAEKIAALSEMEAELLQHRFDTNTHRLEKLTGWADNAGVKAQDAVTASAARQAKFAAGPTGTAEDPLPADDPRLQAGEVFDTVSNEEWGTFHRRRDGVYPNEPYAFRVQVDREINPEELSQLSKILGSAYATTGQNEGLSWPEQDTPYSFIVGADTTKGRAYRNLDRMEENLAAYLVDGSPKAKTNRGRVPMGERYVNGFGDDAPKLELYYEGQPFVSE